MKCKKCGKQVHYCSSCGFVSYAIDEGYCSESCWESSKEYQEAMDDFVNFSYDFNDKQLKFLFYLLDGEYSNYEAEFIEKIRMRTTNRENF